MNSLASKKKVQWEAELTLLLFSYSHYVILMPGLNSCSLDMHSLIFQP